MTDYTKLIKALRCKTNNVNDCTMCAYHNACYDGTLELIAADAIERLMAEVEELKTVIAAERKDDGV